MTPHEFEPDEEGDCRRCPLPRGNAVHAVVRMVPAADKRPINLLTKDEGMALAATSRSSEELRRTFFLAMGEVAVRQTYLTTNDAWDLLEQRGYQRSGHANAVGTIGPSGQAIGLWKRTEQKARNTSGNLHSTDDGVRVYQSLVVGRDFETDVAPKIIAKATALAEQAAKREQAKAAAAPTLSDRIQTLATEATEQGHTAIAEALDKIRRQAVEAERQGTL